MCSTLKTAEPEPGPNDKRQLASQSEVSVVLALNTVGQSLCFKMEKKIHSDRNHVAKIKNLSGRREQRQMVWEIKEEICRSSSCTFRESM